MQDDFDDNTNVFDGPQESIASTIKNLISDNESRSSILDFFKNISLFVAGAYVITQYADSISDSKELLTLIDGFQ